MTDHSIPVCPPRDKGSEHVSQWCTDLQRLIFKVLFGLAPLPAREQLAVRFDTHPDVADIERLTHFAKAALDSFYPDRFWPDEARADVELGEILALIAVSDDPMIAKFVRLTEILRYLFSVPDRDELVALAALAGNQRDKDRAIGIVDRAYRRHSEGIEGLPPEPALSGVRPRDLYQQRRYFRRCILPQLVACGLVVESA